MIPTTLSGGVYFLIRCWDEILIATMWKLIPGEARMSASIHDATPPRM